MQKHHPMKTNVLFLFASLALAISCTTKPEETPDTTRTEKPAETGIYVKTEPVSLVEEIPTVSVIGIIISKTDAKPAFKTGGVIDKTMVKEGDAVKPGQLLATLIMTEIDAQVRQAEEGLAKAQRDFDRVSNLFADSVATLEQKQNAGSALTLATETLAIAKFNQNHSEVRSPIAGRVIKQVLHQGEIAGPGMPVYAIMGIADQDWRIQAGLTDRDWARVKTGDKATVSMDAYPGESFAARISDKARLTQNASGTLNIELSFADQPASLAAGMTCKVLLSPAIQSIQTTIPVDALVDANGSQATVYSIEGGKAVKHQVTISRLLGDRVVIAGGLEGVDAVVTIGSIYLENGDAVILANQ